MSQTSPEPPPSAVARALVGGLALMLALAGQFALAITPHWLWQGLLLSGAALLLFIWASLRPPPAWLMAVVSRRRITFGALLFGIATLLSLLAALLSSLFAELGRTNYLPVLVLLALGSITYVAAFLEGRRLPTLQEVRGQLQAHRTELAALALVTLAAFAIRFYRLGDLPAVINGDEGLLGQAAIGTGDLPLANPFSLFENFGGLYMQGIGLAIHTFGRTAFALRLLPALGGVLAVAALYLLGRQLFGARVGLLAACLLAVAHAHIHFSRSVAVGYIQGTWMGPLVLYFFYSGLQRRSPARMAAGGLLLGIFFSVYLGAQILAAFLIVFVPLAALLCRPLLRGNARAVAVFWYGVILTVLPQAIYSIGHPQEFFSRLNSEGTFQSGWLVSEAARTGAIPPLLLVGRVGHAFLSLIYYPALDFYGVDVPLLSFVCAALFLFGVGYGLVRTRRPEFLLLNGFFWSSTLAIGMFAIPPTADSYRMLVALPAALLFAAAGWEQLLALLSTADPSQRQVRRGFTVLLVVAVALINLRVYFVDFTGHCLFGGDLQTRFASRLGSYLADLDREATVAMLSTDQLQYGTHSSVDFLSEDHRVTNVSETVDTIDPLGLDVLIAPAARADELRAWAHDRSDGEFDTVFDCQEVMFLAYRLP